HANALPLHDPHTDHRDRDQQREHLAGADPLRNLHHYRDLDDRDGEQEDDEQDHHLDGMSGSSEIRFGPKSHASSASRVTVPSPSSPVSSCCCCRTASILSSSRSRTRLRVPSSSSNADAAVFMLRPTLSIWST